MQARQQSSRGARRWEGWHLRRVGRYTQRAARGPGGGSGAASQERPALHAPTQKRHKNTHSRAYNAGKGSAGQPVT